MTRGTPSGAQTLALDRRSVTPLRRQLYERLRDAITRGTLQPGERLPSARTLANQLAVARGTVDAAYATLAGEGYIVSRGAAGTVVAEGVAGELIARSRRNVTRRPLAPGTAAAIQPFQMGLPAMDAFPRKLWARLAVRQARTLSVAAMHVANPAGHQPLREALTRYLAVARGIDCAPEQIFITGGFQGALGLITRVLLKQGEQVWLEDPGYVLARAALAAAGARIVPVPVDDEGLDVAAAVDSAPRARMALVTPSHQMPLGVALSLRRRLALLNWARAAKAWIVEDDYDSEYRYRGPPLPALKSLDGDARVLYVGTFSKVLFPGLRMGYAVVPEPLVQKFGETCRMLHPDRSLLVQSIVTEFIDQGHFARHIRRMRGLYARRRSALASALTEVFPDRLRLELQAGGMHLLARLNCGESDVRLVELARARGLAPQALSRMAIRPGGGQGLLLGFTNIPEEQALAQARRLEQALRA